MAPGKIHSKGAGLDEKLVKDHDPEADVSQTRGESKSEESGDELVGTEHYVSVGKSKLRQRDEVPLGPQYRGAQVSRAALEGSSSEEDEDIASDESEFDDPDLVDLEADEAEDEDAEIDSDDALGESDLDKYKEFKFRGSSRPRAETSRVKRRKAADFFSDSEEDNSESSDEDDSRLNGARLSSSDEEEEEEDDDDRDSDDNSDSDGDAQRAELRRIMSEGQKKVISTISQAAKADAAKGRAVRQQRRTFDALLNLRIRLQKALVAANSFSATETDDQDDDDAPYRAAEEAAVKLWSSIDGFRQSMLPESARAKMAGQKRKRGDDAWGPESTVQAMWEAAEETEKAALAHRRRVLDKWSARMRNTTATATTRRLGPAAETSQSLVSVLDDQLLGSGADRLVRRAQTPRSCAPLQAARKVAHDPQVYDDADFYQLLLKELVDQRTLDSGGGAGGINGAGTTVRWAALKEAKTRKQVDRKASKGRKLRYTVHEKLQNFMAPEDRRGWEQEAIDRFFGTLFGQKLALGEDDEAGESDEEMNGVGESEGLRLF